MNGRGVDRASATEINQLACPGSLALLAIYPVVGRFRLGIMGGLISG